MKQVKIAAVSLIVVGILGLSPALSETRNCHIPPPPELAPGLVGQYHLDEGSGMVAFDSSGYGNDGILWPHWGWRKPRWVEGIYGTALNFAHNHSLVWVPHNYTLNLNELSISAWIKTVSNKSKRMIVNKARNFWCRSRGYAFCVSPPGRKGRLGFWSSGNTRWAKGNSRVNDGNWHHVMVILEEDNCYFYVDGELDAVVPSAPPRPSWRAMLIGAQNCGHPSFDGIIDEVNIYNCAIPAPRWRDIVINEVNYSGAPNPLFPEVGFEYIELYNRGDIPVTLDSWVLMDREVILFTFPSGEEAITMPPKSLIVIYSSAAAGTVVEDLDLSDGTGNIISGPEWPEYELRDTGDSVQLYSSTVLDEISIVDFVAYDEHNEQKFPELDENAVAAGIWSDDAAIDTLSSSSSYGRALYLLEDGNSPHEATGNDEEDLDWGQYRSNEGGTPGSLNPPPPPIITPTPSIAPTSTPSPPTPTPTVTPTPIPTPSYLIDQGFNEFHLGVRPSGWSFINCDQNSATYTTTNNFGETLPSLKLDATGDTIITETFSSPSTLSFWVKGMSTDSSSCLLVEEYCYNSGWSQVTQIENLPTTGTNYGSLNLNPSSSQLKFSYSKNMGNLAFDDVQVTD